MDYERIQDMSDLARFLDRDRDNWRQHGHSEKWIQQRMMGQETHNNLTDYWKDHEVHRMLRINGVRNPKGEWFSCTVDQMNAAAIAVRTGQLNEENRSLDFKMRPEQETAVEKTAVYFKSFRKEDLDKPPHFLWNAKMRFGKTFAAHQQVKSRA